jgi:hypothetical protein
MPPPYDKAQQLAQEEAPETLPPEDMAQDIPPDPLNSPMAGGMVQASPEEQEMADQFVGRAWELIYDDETFPQIVEMLKGGGGEAGDPVKGLAQATDMVVAKVGQAAEDEGAKLQPDPVFHAFGDILEELAEVSRRAKIKDYAQDHAALETAYFQALDIYRERLASAGVLDEESHKQGMAQLMQADKDGTLEKIMRELAESDAAGQAGGEEPPPESKPKRKGMGTAIAAPPGAKEELMERVA